MIEKAGKLTLPEEQEDDSEYAVLEENTQNTIAIEEENEDEDSDEEDTTIRE